MSTLKTSNLQHASAASANITLASDGTTTIAAPSNIIKSGTAVASTSGTSIDFTGIPNWVKRITVMFDGVSTNGSSFVLIRLGDSGGVETTSYNSGSYYLINSATNGFLGDTTGFVVLWGNAAGNRYGIMQIDLLDGSTNLWTSKSNFYVENGASSGSVFGAGNKSLSATLDRIRITTANGTDTFDAGSINIMYEG